MLTFLPFKWTAENVERLGELIAQRCSASQIGAELGCSRNAVIGKVDRLGWKLPNKPAGGRKARKTIPRTIVNKIRTRMEINSQLEQTEAAELPPDKSDLAVRLVDAGPNQCRYPLDEPTAEMMVCGHPVFIKGYPYCSRHHKICYTSGPKQFYTQEEIERRRAQGRKNWKFWGKAA